MTTDRDRILNLSNEVVELQRHLAELKAKVTHLTGGTQALVAGLDEAVQAHAELRSSVHVLSERVLLELRRARAQRKIVYVVDDDPDVRAMATEALLGAGIAAQAFARADDVVEVLPLAIPKAVLIDLKVPGMSGGALAEYLRTNARTVRVRRLGMTTFVPTPQEARSFTSFIDKPLDPQSLVQFVDHAMRTDMFRVSPSRP